MIKTFSQSCFVAFQMTYLHLRNAVFCTSNIKHAKKNSGIKLLTNIVLISKILPAFLKYKKKTKTSETL